MAGKRLGLLINFHEALIRDRITRIANGMPDGSHATRATPAGKTAAFAGAEYNSSV